MRERRASLKRGHLVALALALLLFLAISAVLARFLSTENLERREIYAVLKAQAAGDARGMLAHLKGCAARRKCLGNVRYDAAHLRRPGPVKILLLGSKTAYQLTGASGQTRVAWTVIGRQPVVQCVDVKRSGNFLTGMSVQLRSISAPISNESGC